MAFPWDVFGWMMGAGLIFAGFWLLVIVGLFIFWLWMIIDLLQRKMDDKLIWIIVLVFLQFLGAILYYLLVYSKHKGRK